MNEVKPTNYTIQEENNRYTVYENDTLVIQGCLTEEDALHAIWVTEGKVPDDFYVVDDKGVVLCVDRDML